MAGMDGKGGAVGKQIMAAAPETPIKGSSPELLVASPSPAKKNAYLDFGKDDDARDASVKTLPGTPPSFARPFWLCGMFRSQVPPSTPQSTQISAAANLETDADKAARLQRRRLAEERLAEVEASRRVHMIVLVKELVHEIFVDGVCAKIFPFAHRTSSPHPHSKLCAPVPTPCRSSSEQESSTWLGGQKHRPGNLPQMQCVSG